MNSNPTREGSRHNEAWTPSADLGECVAGLVNVVARGMADLVAPHGLIPLEFALLRLFLRQEEWTTTRLAQVLPVKVSRISRIVTKLVDRGLMRRRRPVNDRRVVFLTLTDEGRALTGELHRRVSEYEARLSEGVSEEEMEVLASAASKILANYSALSQPQRENVNGSHRVARAQPDAATE